MFKINNICFIIASAGTLLAFVVFLFGSKVDFIQNFNQFAQPFTKSDNSYNAIIESAKSAGLTMTGSHPFSATLPTDKSDFNHDNLNCCYSHNLKRCIEQIKKTTSLEECIDIVLPYFSSSNFAENLNNRMEFVLKRIFVASANIKVNDLSYETRYSLRHLHRIFKSNFGISIKSFLRILRFQKALISLQTDENKLSKIALDLGYYDQAHFVHEFKQFTSLTPSKYSYFWN